MTEPLLKQPAPICVESSQGTAVPFLTNISRSLMLV
jgi:hypothetical protein